MQLKNLKHIMYTTLQSTVATTYLNQNVIFSVKLNYDSKASNRTQYEKTVKKQHTSYSN